MCNLSLQYPHTIHQTGDEDIQNNIEVVILIQHQILAITGNLQGNVKQLEGIINNQVLGVKGLNLFSPFCSNVRAITKSFLWKRTLPSPTMPISDPGWMWYSLWIVIVISWVAVNDAKWQ